MMDREIKTRLDEEGRNWIERLKRESAERAAARARAGRSVEALRIAGAVLLAVAATLVAFWVVRG